MSAFYRFVLVVLLLLVMVGAVEYGAWWQFVVIVLFGYAVWRAELPAWDELWDRDVSGFPEQGDTERR